MSNKIKAMAILFLIVSLFLVTGCGEQEEVGTKGLEFSLLEDGTYAVSVGYAGNIRDIVIPSHYNNKKVTKIADSGFSETSVKSVVIPNTVTTIGDNAFASYKLEKVNIPKSVKIIGDGAFAYSSLKEVTIPSSVQIIGSNAFECVGITEVTIPSSVQTIGSNAFSFCHNLTEVTVYAKAIDFKAFYSCGSLEKVIIGDGVEVIGMSAFSTCISLTDVSISDTVNEIEDYSFDDCRSLKRIKFQGTQSQWKSALESDTTIPGEITVLYNS